MQKKKCFLLLIWKPCYWSTWKNNRTKKSLMPLERWFRCFFCRRCWYGITVSGISYFEKNNLLSKSPVEANESRLTVKTWTAKSKDFELYPKPLNRHAWWLFVSIIFEEAFWTCTLSVELKVVVSLKRSCYLCCYWVAKEWSGKVLALADNGEHCLSTTLYGWIFSKKKTDRFHQLSVFIPVFAKGPFISIGWHLLSWAQKPLGGHLKTLVSDTSLFLLVFSREASFLRMLINIDDLDKTFSQLKEYHECTYNHF